MFGHFCYIKLDDKLGYFITVIVIITPWLCRIYIWISKLTSCSQRYQCHILWYGRLSHDCNLVNTSPISINLFIMVDASLEKDIIT